MNDIEFTSRISAYYASHKPKMGLLSFDKVSQRFIIKSLSGRRINMTPSDGLHCGDVYIVQDVDKTWRIAQCEHAGNEWKMLGSLLSEKMCDNQLILFIPGRRLNRIRENYIDESFRLPALSDNFVIDILLNKKGR